jgi:hypothetical protein
MKIYIIFSYFITYTLAASLNESERIFLNSKLKFKQRNHVILNISEPEVKFFALGDWGGGGWWSSTPSQKSAALRMGEIASVYSTHFQLGLGDNFYCLFIIKKF